MFSVAAPRTELLPYEPLVLEFRLTNDGDAGTEAYAPDPTGPLTVTVRTPDNRSFRLAPNYSRDGYHRPVVLPPATSYSERHFFENIGGTMSLSSPGTYTLAVEHDAGPGGGRLVAEPLAIHVREPEGLDAQAVALIAPQRAQWRAVTSGCVTPTGEKPGALAQELCGEEYADTRYGRYARFSRARNLLSRRSSAEAQEQALDGFQELADGSGQFPLADTCLLWLGEANQWSGRLEEAIAALERLRDEFPDSPLMYGCLVHLAYTYLKAGRTEDAVQAYGTARRCYSPTVPRSTEQASVVRTAEYLERELPAETPPTQQPEDVPAAED